MKKFLMVVALLAAAAGFNQYVYAGGGSSNQVVDDNIVDICSQTPWLSVCGNADKITLIKGVDSNREFTVAVWTGCDNERLFEVIGKEDNMSYFFQEGTADLIYQPAEVEPRIYWGDDRIQLILPESYSTQNMGVVPICKPFAISPMF